MAVREQGARGHGFETLEKTDARRLGNEIDRKRRRGWGGGCRDLEQLVREGGYRNLSLRI